MREADRRENGGLRMSVRPELRCSRIPRELLQSHSFLLRCLLLATPSIQRNLLKMSLSTVLCGRSEQSNAASAKSSVVSMSGFQTTIATGSPSW